MHRSTEHPHCNSFSTVNGMQPIAQGDRARPESFGLSYWTAFGTNSAAKSPTIGSRWPSRRRARTRKHGRGKFFCFSQRVAVFGVSAVRKLASCDPSVAAARARVHKSADYSRMHTAHAHYLRAIIMRMRITHATFLTAHNTRTRTHVHTYTHVHLHRVLQHISCM